MWQDSGPLVRGGAVSSCSYLHGSPAVNQAWRGTFRMKYNQSKVCIFCAENCPYLYKHMKSIKLLNSFTFFKPTFFLESLRQLHFVAFDWNDLEDQVQSLKHASPFSPGAANAAANVPWLKFDESWLRHNSKFVMVNSRDPFFLITENHHLPGRPGRAESGVTGSCNLPGVKESSRQTGAGWGRWLVFFFQIFEGVTSDFRWDVGLCMV